MEEIERFLSENKFLDRLHGLEISAICNEKSINFLSKSSKQIVEFSDPNYLHSSKAAEALELLQNILDDKYLNGIYIEFGDGAVSSNVSQTSVFDNVALAAQFATEFQNLKRYVFFIYQKCLGK